MKIKLAFLISVFILAPLYVKATAQNCFDSREIIFTPDRQWWACLISSGGKFSIARNGGDDYFFDQVGSPDFSFDSREMAYKARNGKEWFVMSGDRTGGLSKGKSYDEIESIIWDLESTSLKFLVFGPRGDLVYAGREGKAWFVVLDGATSGPYDWVRPVVFNPNGSKMAYKALVGDKWFMVVDGKKQNSYDWVGFPVWSLDGKKVAYRARSGNEWFVIADGKKQKSYPEVGFPVWSLDSQSVVYKASDARGSFVVVNKNESRRYEEINSLSVNPNHRYFEMLTFEPVSEEVVYLAKRDGKWFKVEGDKETDDLNLGMAVSVPPKPKFAENKHSVLESFQKTSREMRSLASRMETRLDKLTEKKGFNDLVLRSQLVEVREEIHRAEERFDDDLPLAKSYLVSAKQKFRDLINQVRLRETKSASFDQ